MPTGSALLVDEREKNAREEGTAGSVSAKSDTPRRTRPGRGTKRSETSRLRVLARRRVEREEDGYTVVVRKSFA